MLSIKRNNKRLLQHMKKKFKEHVAAIEDKYAIRPHERVDAKVF